VSNWPAIKARRVLAALERIGWRVKRQSGSHKLLARDGWPDYEFAFHDNEELGRKILSRQFIDVTGSRNGTSLQPCRPAASC
jgi:predicted RNA binding protein YcfA (HicA-like mRNA interferase family)